MTIPAQSDAITDRVADASNAHIDRKHVEDAMLYDGIDGVVALVRDRIADRINAALADVTSAHTVTAHGVSCRIVADPNAATRCDPAGVVTSCEVAGHPDVVVHSHSSTTVDGAVTIAVDAPDGTIIRLDINDADITQATVGQ